MPINLLHKIAFEFYNLGWRVALPWLKFNHRLAAGYPQRTLKEAVTQSADLWIQAASVGESFLALEIIKYLKKWESLHILLTSNTLQGVEILNQALQKQAAETNQHRIEVRYFPFDQPALMLKAVGSIRPRLMVLLEMEIWPGLLRALKESDCKIMIINGRITAHSLKRYLLWPSIWQALRPDKILAISQSDAERFGRLFGSTGIEIMSNIKFDRLNPAPDTRGANRQLSNILPSDAPFLVLASIRREEESLVKKIIAEIVNGAPQCIIGLFPRHMHRLKAWQKSLNGMGVQWVLRSELEGRLSSGRVVLWDTIGELSAAYRLAKTAFVGGSLAPLGGQNFLEAIISGVVPVTGPSWENFAWVGPEITETGLLKVADGWQEVARILLAALDQPAGHDEIIRRGLSYISKHQGSTHQACRQIETFLM